MHEDDIHFSAIGAPPGRRPLRFLSLFSGIEAASQAWLPLGWDCAAVAEIEPFPCALLAHRYPGVPNLGDVTGITEERIKQLGPIDVVVGGFPCQDLSTAGKRKGFHDADGTTTRSGLFFTGHRIFQWAREHCGARFLLLENVPGLFSSNRGRDFAAVVGHMAGLEDVPVPRHGWGAEGVAVGDHGLLEWCMLDAQHFGLAQRRKRVFALLDTGDWAGRPPVLLEPEGLRGDHPPRRGQGQGSAAGIGRSAEGGGGTGGAVARTLTSRYQKGPDSDCTDTLIAHTLLGEGFDGSHDGTGRGTPLVPIPYRIHGEHSTAITGNGAARVTDPAATARCLDPCGGYSADQGGNVVAQPVAFNWQGGGTQTTLGYDPASVVTGSLHVGQTPAVAIPSAEPFTLAIRGRGGNNHLEYRQDGTANALLTPNGGRAGIGVGAVAIPIQEAGKRAGVSTTDARAGVGIGQDGDPMHTLQAGAQHAIAFAQNTRDEVRMIGGDGSIVGALAAQAGMKQQSYVQQAMVARRITPTEAERLQGFPDGYTLVPFRGKPAADGNRYKALGNSMAVPVMAWIGERIAIIESISKEDE